MYLLTDNSHYNFLGYEEDHLETLELNKDGNFTDNLLNYLDGKKINDDDVNEDEEEVQSDEEDNDSDEEENDSDDEVQENYSDGEENDSDENETNSDDEVRENYSDQEKDNEVQKNISDDTEDGEVYISSDNEIDSDGNKSVGDSKRCEKCKVRIKSSMKKFTSKNFNDKTNKIETIYFCCINCFKDFEKWIK